MDIIVEILNKIMLLSLQIIDRFGLIFKMNQIYWYITGFTQ